MQVFQKFIFVFSLLTFSLFAETFTMPQKEFDEIKKIYGEMAFKRTVALLKMMNKYANADEMEKVVQVNNFFNMVKYNFDIKVWGEEDYWASRDEFLGKGEGDCEDYSIAKYFTLAQMGVSTSKLYMTYVKALKLNRAHMVLSYFKEPRTIPLVLDNYNFKLLPATKRTDLKPVASFNGDQLYLAKQRGLGKVVPGGNNKNQKWLQLLNKIKKN